MAATAITAATLEIHKRNRKHTNVDFAVEQVEWQLPMVLPPLAIPNGVANVEKPSQTTTITQLARVVKVRAIGKTSNMEIETVEPKNSAVLFMCLLKT